jgi:hypothetical protein
MEANMYTYLECVKCGKIDSLTPEALELVNAHEDYLCYPCESMLSALDSNYSDCEVCGAEESVKYYGFSSKAFCSACGQRYDILWTTKGPELEPFFDISEPAVAVMKTVCNMAHSRLEHGYKLLTALRRLVSQDKETAALMLEGMAEIAKEGFVHDDYVRILEACSRRLDAARRSKRD